MFDILKPGCGGVLTTDDVESLSLDRLEAAEDLTTIGLVEEEPLLSSDLPESVKPLHTSVSKLYL